VRAFTIDRRRAIVSGIKPETEHLTTDEAEYSARESLAERVKELECLYGISRVLHDSDTDVPHMLREIVEILPRGFKYPHLAGARISAAAGTFQTGRFSLGPLTLAATTAAGRVEVSYPAGLAASDPAPFLPEEHKLIEKAAADISLALERIRAAEEKKRLEAQLRHADRLSTMGVMAAGITHELNEPLAAILGFAQLVAKTPHLPQQAALDTQRIVEACLRAREIVRGLLVFGGTAPQKSEDCNLATIVRDGIVFLEPRCKSAGIALRLDFGTDVPLVLGDPAQLTQVLVNLVVNAVQAMPAGGTLTVRTVREGSEALLIVEDTGIGISAETLGRLFVPFFTTKGTGGGTGLGLPVVHGIVSSHGGSIGVTSSAGEGARFEVRLPSRGTLPS
jgi:signal transduction histidine kinase